MCLPNTPGHGGKQLWPNSRPGEWTLGNTDPARRRFGEIRNALVEVHIPAFYAANHLLLRDYGARRAGVGADLAGGAERVAPDAGRCSGDERHIRGDTCQTHPRSEFWTDQRAVLAEFSQ